MVNLSLGLINEAPHDKYIWGNGGIAPVFLASALDGGEWSVLMPWPL
jgi:hypothetical protein